MTDNLIEANKPPTCKSQINMSTKMYQIILHCDIKLFYCFHVQLDKNTTTHTHYMDLHENK